jgi:hypothetical protein
MAVGLGQVACAAPSQVCPSRVHVASGALAPEDVPAGFHATFSDSQVWLTGFSVFEGPPAQGAALVPDLGKGDVATWKFQGTAPEGRWLSCDYAEGLIHLAVRADDQAKSCQGRFAKSGDPKLPHAEFSCR